MKYVVDRIENNIAVLENLNNKEKIEVNVSELPTIKEGSVLVFENNTYLVDEETEKDRMNQIKSKFDMLRKK